MRKLWVTTCVLTLCALVLTIPVLAEGNAKGLDRIPAINVAAEQAVVVPKIAVEKSEVLEPADIVVELDRGAFFILLEEGAVIDPEGFSSTLENLLHVRVEIVSTKPFLWVRVGAERDEVFAALEEMEEILDWLAGRAAGWGTYW